MCNVDVQQSFEREAIGDIGVGKIVVCENFGQGVTQRSEHALGNVDTEFVFEELEHLGTVECL